MYFHCCISGGVIIKLYFNCINSTYCCHVLFSFYVLDLVGYVPVYTHTNVNNAHSLGYLTETALAYVNSLSSVAQFTTNTTSLCRGQSHTQLSNPSAALPTSQLILQPFRCFTYVTAYSPTLLSLFLRHRLFTYVIWRAAHVNMTICKFNKSRAQFTLMACNALAANGTLGTK